MTDMISTSELRTALQRLKVETPSWGYGNSGTRFKVFGIPGAARDVYERIADAGVVHRYTGICPTVAVHIPWDKVEDYKALQSYANENGVSIGAVNPNLFQDEEYRLGSITNSDPAIRRKAIEAIIECVEIGKEIFSHSLSLWFADGTNYPGQGHIRQRKEWMEEGLAEVYQALPNDMKMLIEYKTFEPAFYHTDIADWGIAFIIAKKLGPKARVLVDTGHHHPGTNIQQIVAILLQEGMLGGFHFNDRKYADDDLIAGSIDPYQLFLIFNEIVDAGELSADVAYMVDQSHGIEPKIPAMIRTVMNIQAAYTKALLVDREALSEAQKKGDVIAANSIIQDAFETDVRDFLAEIREDMGVPADPLRAYINSGYQQKIEKERA
jgi:L-rhamnose isomerase/sugar isomerase